MHLVSFPLICLALQLLVPVASLVVGAPSKSLQQAGEGLKPSKLLLIISHTAPLHVLAPPQHLHHVAVHEQLAHAHTAVSTSSLQAVHSSDPAETSVTHTITQISHPASVSEHHSHPHHVLPHPASTVNGHSLGYGTSIVYKSYEAPQPSHESLYTVHVGGFGVGLHVGGHGHGHGYFAVI